ncbi:MAG: hypothetical protein KKH28_02995, partial [Elusimicrobia bacterium]|nr:hypothetical protein [Elusimicrobiota bacterium]
MKKKANSIIFTIFATVILALPHAPKIVPGGTLLTVAAVAVVVSIPPKCEASIAYGAYASVAILFQPSNCEASIKDQLCSAITGFLNDENTKSAAAVKSCKKNCGLINKKQDLIEAAQKKANDSCLKGLAPDIADVSKGLDKNAKDRLSKLYNRNSQLFDGTDPKLTDKDFNITSKQAPTLTGAGGQVSDLKGSAPDLNKLSPVTEFSLSGTKLSGETPGQTTIKQSPILLVSASSIKAVA